ncbi:MAG: head GIN domain-containing protein [Ginsengibacter sp.]
MKYLLIALIAFSFTSARAQTVINDKNVQQRDVSKFWGIKVSGGIDLYISQSNDYALAVSASEEKYLDEIVTTISDGILTISQKNTGFRMSGDRKLRAYVSFKELESLEATGASDIIINDELKSNALRMKLSGASDIRGKIDIENLVMNISGASTLKLNGHTTNLTLEASGASDLKNYELSVDNCIAVVSGASDIRLTINKSISAKASGASTLYYKGQPQQRNVESSGASSIAQR